MWKFLKIFMFTVIIFLILFMVGLILLANRLDPNRLKPLIIHQIEEVIDGKLTLNGDMKWSFFPTLGITLDELQLDGSNDLFKVPLIKVKHIKFNVKLLPLLRKKIICSKLIIDDAIVNLIKDENGQNNWSLLKTNKIKKKTKNYSRSLQQDSSLTSLKISSININNLGVNLDNKKNGNEFSISNLNLSAKNISKQDRFPINLKMNFFDKNIRGDLALDAELQTNFLDKLVFSKVKAEAILDNKICPNNKCNVSFDSDKFLANKNAIDIPSFQLIVNSNMMNGFVNIRDFKNIPEVRFKLSSDNIDITPWINKRDGAISKTNVSSTSNAQPLSGAKLSLNWLRNFNLNGNISIQHFISKKISIGQTKLKVINRNGLLAIDPIAANLYDGNLTGKVDINAQSQTPIFNGEIELNQIKIEGLLRDLFGYNKLVGVANFNCNLKTQGDSFGDLMQHLNGNTKFNLKNGELNGIDINQLIQMGLALLKKQPMSEEHKYKQTKFSNVYGAANIIKGIMYIDTLKLNSSKIEACGKGSVNLVNQLIRFNVDTNLVGHKHKVPIIIYGRLSNPNVKLNTKVLLTNLAKENIRKHVGKALAKLFK